MARPLTGTVKRDAKLTLSLEPAQRARFHAFATRQKQSLAEIVCRELEELIAAEKYEGTKLRPNPSIHSVKTIKLKKTG